MKRKDTLSGIYVFLHLRKTAKYLNTHSSWVSNRDFFSGIKLIEDIWYPGYLSMTSYIHCIMIYLCDQTDSIVFFIL